MFILGYRSTHFVGWAFTSEFAYYFVDRWAMAIGFGGRTFGAFFCSTWGKPLESEKILASLKTINSDSLLVDAGMVLRRSGFR